jgi:hypothetical protein
MKSVICQLPWKLRTIMCFCHSILIFRIIPIFKIIFIFEIILVFKIMIIIRFQIWFLIKFKLQRKEWVWLKLGFSHAKRLWHYKYRSQRKKKRKNREEKRGENISRDPKNQPRNQSKEQSKNQSKKNIQREGENKRAAHTVTRIILEIVFVPANKGKTRIHSKNTHSRPTSSS